MPDIDTDIERGVYEPSIDRRTWRPVFYGMILLLAAMAVILWVFVDVMVLYVRCEQGEQWVSLRDLKATGASGTAVFAVALLLAGAFAHAIAAVLRSERRMRRAGLALAVASGLPLVIWSLMLLEASRGVNLLGLR